MPDSKVRFSRGRLPERSAKQLHRLECETWVAAPLDRVYEFFADAYNLEAITPPWLNFQVLTPRPIEMQTGTRIKYRLKLHGIPIRWESEISSWDPPLHFVDEQIRGPYQVWHHEHTFREENDGVAVMDVVHYQVPGGSLINWLLVQRDLDKIFTYRRERMIELLSGQSS